MVYFISKHIPATLDWIWASPIIYFLWCYYVILFIIYYLLFI